MDVSYQYLTFFMEDDERLAQIKSVRVVLASLELTSPPGPCYESLGPGRRDSLVPMPLEAGI